VLSFAEYVVDDSEGEDEDFLATALENTGYQDTHGEKVDDPLHS
jgi:hypothetical protein